MNKLSAAEQREVLAEVPGTLRKLVAERDFYRDAFLKNASRQRIEKVAASMIAKGLRSDDVVTVADELEKQAKAGDIDLAVTEKAVELVGPDMGKYAAVSSEHAGGSSEFERYLVS